MRATMDMGIDTAWANKVSLRVEAELDNPHILTTREMASLMLGTLRVMVEEVRAENERTIQDSGSTSSALRSQDREVERLHEMSHKAPDN